MRIYADKRGVVSIEMGIFMLIFSALLIGTIDYASIAGSSGELSNALRTGEQFALSQPGNGNGIIQSIRNASTLPPADVSATTAISCECNHLTALCNSNCVGTMATFVTLTASYRVPLLFTYPGTKNPFPLSKTLTVRVQ